MAALRSRCGHYIVVLFLLFFLAQSQRSEIGCLPYFYIWCGLSANLECRSLCCARLAGNAGPKNRKKSPSGHHSANLWGYIFATKARIGNRKKNLLNSNTFPIGPHNIVNFGPLAAGIDPVVSRTPANFNWFRVFAALLHGTVVVGVSQTLRR